MRTLVVLVTGFALGCGSAHPLVIPDTRYPLEVARDREVEVVVPVREGDKTVRYVVPFVLRPGDYCAVRASALEPTP